MVDGERIIAVHSKDPTLPPSSRADDKQRSRKEPNGAGQRASKSSRGDDEGRQSRRPGGGSRSKKRSEPLAIPLEHARWRHFTSAFAGLVIGGGLIVKLGAVGKIIGIISLFLAARSIFFFARTLLKPAGTIRVNSETVVLPEALCRGTSYTIATGDVRHVYFLRRAVPWTQTAPLLVIETDSQAFIYPRDWFASESDQRRIAQALQHHIDRDRNSTRAAEKASE